MKIIQFQRRLMEILEQATDRDKASKICDVFITTLVLCNILSVILGGFQESCRLKLKSYAATSFCFSGLRNTSPTLSQFRISPLQRSGCRDFAC